MQTNLPKRRRAGFTLTELMIVVSIIGLMASMSIPMFTKARENSQNSMFVADLRVLCDAFTMYCLENRGRYPSNVGAGVVPPGMDEYLGRFNWGSDTPVGGRWNWDYNVHGYTAGVAVIDPSATSEQLQVIDRYVDDGSLGSGWFRSRPNGYVKIIEE